MRVADDVVHLGLAEHLVHRHAERGFRPVADGGPDGFAGAHDAAQVDVEALARPRERLHHHLERRREQERVADPVLLHQRQRALGIEAAAIADDGLAEIERGEQRIHQAAGPGPVGGRPEQVARLRVPVVRVHEARQVADQALLRHQRALGRAGGAAGVDQQRRISRRGGHRLEPRRRLREQLVERRDERLARAGDADDVGEPRHVAADRDEVRQRLRIDQRDLRFGVGQPVGERVRPEQERQRHRDRAELIDGDVRDDRLRSLRQDQRDLVAAAHAEPGERVGQPVGLLLQVPERVRRRRAGLVLPVERKAGPVLRPAPAAGVGDVELRRDVPAVAGADFGVAVGGHGSGWRRSRRRACAGGAPGIIAQTRARGNARSGAAPSSPANRGAAVAVHDNGIACARLRGGGMAETTGGSHAPAEFWHTVCMQVLQRGCTGQQHQFRSTSAVSGAAQWCSPSGGHRGHRPESRQWRPRQAR